MSGKADRFWLKALVFGIGFVIATLSRPDQLARTAFLIAFYLYVKQEVFDV